MYKIKYTSLVIFLILLTPFIFSQDWKSATAGVDYFTFAIRKKHIKYTVARLDLSCVSPLGYYGRATTVKKFAKKNNCIIAFNTTPFTKNKKAVGIVFIDDILLSPPNTKYDAATFYNNTVAFMNQSHFTTSFKPGTNLDPESNSLHNLIMGGFWITKQSKLDNEFKVTRNARVAVATNDGKKLFVLAGKGLSYKMCNDILKELGCTDVLQFDGGHSTSLIIKNKEQVKIMLRRRVPAMIGFIPCK